MRILHASAECVPLVKIGGLADVVGALPKSQRRLGNDASVIMPGYAHLMDEVGRSNIVWTGAITYAGQRLPFRVCALSDSVIGIPVYLVEEPVHFSRPGVYQDASTGEDFHDQGDRFAVFQLAVLHYLKSHAREIDVVHLHDHHTGLLPYFIKKLREYSTFDGKVVYTVHSAEHQGRYPLSEWRKFGDSAEPPEEVRFHGKINSMKAGIVMADAVTTVSPSYVEELLESDVYARGLRPVFRSAKTKLHGILNGIDRDVWHPERDEYLPFRYSAVDLSGKRHNKEALCDLFDLNPGAALLTFIGRLVDEKGVQILPEAFEHLLEVRPEVNIFVLGTGYPQYEKLLAEAAERHQVGDDINGRLTVRLEFNNELAHRLYAASDFLLMPSRVEPCGLNQLYALTYGTIPVVHAVGGLKDTVTEFDAGTRRGNGFTFDEFSADAFASAMDRAMETYAEGNAMATLRQNAMRADWSWEASANRYLDLYISANRS